eukprot:TRINITY_DN5594_c0_g1_i1.p3 TRINITY_DN5594_c0_g1~~TRINITY_DN5594_c0_g1_i1.p3  ORF type:complete len:139 (+),score=17.47 TRINITY_DN5594_c0_g1_i1:414-830(+)
MAPSTCSTFSAVSGSPAAFWVTTSSTAWISGMTSMRRRLIPIAIVTALEAHDPHAPCSRRYTTGPSISTSSTFPPVRDEVGSQLVQHTFDVGLRKDVRRVIAFGGRRGSAGATAVGLWNGEIRSSTAKYKGDSVVSGL